MIFIHQFFYLAAQTKANFMMQHTKASLTDYVFLSFEICPVPERGREGGRARDHQLSVTNLA